VRSLKTKKKPKKKSGRRRRLLYHLHLLVRRLRRELRLHLFQ
jgi:hypothetical protein